MFRRANIHPTNKPPKAGRYTEGIHGGKLERVLSIVLKCRAKGLGRGANFSCGVTRLRYQSFTATAETTTKAKTHGKANLRQGITGLDGGGCLTPRRDYTETAVNGWVVKVGNYFLWVGAYRYNDEQVGGGWWFSKSG